MYLDRIVKSFRRVKINGQRVAVSVLLCFSGLALAQEQLGHQASVQTSVIPQAFVELVDTPVHHQIPLSNDRFRVDYEIESLTLAIFRKNDSAPVVLTRPDGSKWYASRHPKEEVTWKTGHNYDFIEIKNPQPGPWQITGQVMPESRVMVVSDIEFHPELFPSLIFVGEQIKLTGTLSQAGQPIEQLDFRNVIRLTLYFHSVNDPQYDNFGQPPIEIGEYLDDGKQLDEKPKDGIFTGQFKLAVTPGLYVPKYIVRTPLHERLFEAEPILVHRTPVQPKIAVSGIEGKPHELTFEVDDSVIDPSDIALTGRISYPNGERQQVAISTAQGDSLTLKIPSYTYGVFEVRARMSGTDKYGREFQINLPYFEFRSQRQREQGPTAEELARLAEAENLERVHQETLAQIADSRHQKQTKIVLVVVINLLLVASWGLFMLLRKPKLVRHVKNRKIKK